MRSWKYIQMYHTNNLRQQRKKNNKITNKRNSILYKKAYKSRDRFEWTQNIRMIWEVIWYKIKIGFMINGRHELKIGRTLMKTPSGIWTLPDQPKTLLHGLLRCSEVYICVFICFESWSNINRYKTALWVLWPHVNCYYAFSRALEWGNRGIPLTPTAKD